MSLRWQDVDGSDGDGDAATALADRAPPDDAVGRLP